MDKAHKKTGVYCLANDNVIEWFEAFIRSYQIDNSGLPLTVIPFNGNISRLKDLQARFRFDILPESESSRFDALASVVMGSNSMAGTYRKFACFFGPYDEFLFLDSDIVVTTPLLKLFSAYARSDHDFVYFDYALEMAYAPAMASRMVAEYGTHGFNSGAFLSRKGILREEDLWSLAQEAAAARDGLLPGTYEQSFFNFALDVSRKRMTGMNTLLPELADKVWAGQAFDYDKNTRTARTPDGKILPFIHWPGCAYPTMVRQEIFLEYRTLGMSPFKKNLYLLDFNCRRQLKQRSMKSLVKKALVKSARNEKLWPVLNATLLKLSRFLERERHRNENAPPPPVLDLDAALKSISPGLTVRHGVFRGLKYPEEKSVGSALIPKLLGSYEQELQPLLQQLRARDYSEIVDIGCAEGYYAVGLGRLFPDSKIFAYDTNPESIRLCRLMAQANQIGPRMNLGSFCDAATLQNLPLTRRALVVSDCEGYEKHLFTADTIRKLGKHDVLIEVHDFIDIAISSRLRAVFEATHELEVIPSVDDVKKAQTYDYPELASFDLAQRKILLAEHRPGIMEWFYFSPRVLE